MRTGILTVVLLVLLSFSAFADDSSPYQYLVRQALERVQTERGDALTKKGAKAIKKALRKLKPALAVFGKLDKRVEVTWVLCDSVGTAGTPYVVGVNCRVVLVDGYLRRFLVYVPDAGALTEARPLVVMHHGTSHTGEKEYGRSGWREKADETGLVCAFPTGLQYYVPELERFFTKWNKYGLVDMVSDAKKPAEYPDDAPWPADDVEFNRVLLDDLVNTLGVDKHHLLATGSSNGALFTQRLAIELSDRYDAAGWCSSYFASTTDAPAGLIPLIALLGADDEVLLDEYNSSHPGDGLNEWPLDPTKYLALHGVEGAIRGTLTQFQLEFDPHEEYEDEHGTYTRYRFATPMSGNSAGNVLEHRVLDGVQHRYPSGYNPHGFVAADIIWEFFTTEVP